MQVILEWVILLTLVDGRWNILCLMVWVIEMQFSTCGYISEKKNFYSFSNHFSVDVATTPFNAGQSLSCQWATGLRISQQRSIRDTGEMLEGKGWNTWILLINCPVQSASLQVSLKAMWELDGSSFLLSHVVWIKNEILQSTESADYWGLGFQTLIKHQAN